jgi:hypothetical protein
MLFHGEKARGKKIGNDLYSTIKVGTSIRRRTSSHKVAV